MQIKLYIRSGCPYCDMVRNILKYHNVEYEVIEISRNTEKQKELIELSGQSATPVLIVDDKVFIGFDREKIKEVLGIKDNKNL